MCNQAGGNYRVLHVDKMECSLWWLNGLLGWVWKLWVSHNSKIKKLREISNEFSTRFSSNFPLNRMLKYSCKKTHIAFHTSSSSIKPDHNFTETRIIILQKDICSNFSVRIMLGKGKWKNCVIKIIWYFLFLLYFYLFFLDSWIWIDYSAGNS